MHVCAILYEARSVAFALTLHTHTIYNIKYFEELYGGEKKRITLLNSILLSQLPSRR